METLQDVIIIGSGAAGYTAAIYASRAGLSPLLFDGPQKGGQLTITTEVENFPGFAKPIQGPWLMEQMRQQAIATGTKMIEASVSQVDLTAPPFLCHTLDHGSFRTKSLIIATGAKAKALGIPGEDDYMGRGVSTCATCDGAFFRNQDVIIIGGGNSAVEEALYLTNLCKSVTLLHRRDSLRAESILQKRLFASAKIRVLWRHVVLEFRGEPTAGLRSVLIQNLQNQEVEEIHPDGAFVAIGHDPETKLFTSQIDCDSFGYIQTKSHSTLTSKAGVFAAGDCADSVFRQAVTAAGMGCMAALEAEKYLSEKKG